MKNVENVDKVRNQATRKEDLCKGSEERPTYLAILGLKHTGTRPRPITQLTRGGRWGGGAAWGWPHP
jgi:hypothetical protein